MTQKITLKSNPKASKEMRAKVKGAVKAVFERKKMEEISLRDYFAGRAMNGIIEEEMKSTRVLKDWEGCYDRIAESCYFLADAMIAERNKK